MVSALNTPSMRKMIIGAAAAAILGILALIVFKGASGSGVDYFKDPGAAVSLLRKKVDGPVAIMELDIRAKNIMGFKVQNPRQKAEIDEYMVINGKVHKEGPATFTNNFTEAEANENVTPIETVNFSLIPVMAKNALTNTKLKDAHLELVVLRCGRDRQIWTLHLRDARGRNDMPEFDRNGAPRS